MKVYVETNFLLQLAFVQEQHEECLKILNASESGKTTLILPAFCIAESFESLGREVKERAKVVADLEPLMRQLSRAKPYRDEINALGSIRTMLTRSNEQDEQRLAEVHSIVLLTSQVISLDFEIIRNAASFRKRFGLQPQDSIVFASIQRHLASEKREESCFISPDRHFLDPNIREELNQLS
jgi:predicted nucleic acid-binding protein